MAEMNIPEFWKSIETHLSIQPEGIQFIKEILSLLNYTTIQSLTKFTNPKEIKLVELEFMSRRKEFGEKFPHLSEFSFGSGTVSILQDIAGQVKKKFVHIGCDNIDCESILKKVLSDGQKVIFLAFFVEILHVFICD